jgi:hypothetical protein
MSWAAIKVFAPYVIGALLLAALAGLVMDRNRLAKLNDAHQACLLSVEGKPGANPLPGTCDAPIAADAEAAAASAACDAALASGDTFATSQACSGPTKRVIADRDAQASEVANLTSQLASATADRDAAVTRANARAQASLQGFTHAQSVLAAAPHDSSGSTVCDADCLRGISEAQP